MTVPPLIRGVPNLRDLGGHVTAEGARVRHGTVFRSDDLDLDTEADAAAFASLRLAVVFDLRTRSERDAKPDLLPPGVDHVVLDVLADLPRAGAATLHALIGDTALATRVLGGGRAVVLFERTYRLLVAGSSARAAYRRLFLELSDDRRRPALFHCTTGKDRTGWAAAALLLLLGVAEADVVVDYLRSNDAIVPAYRHVVDGFAARGGDPALLWPIIEVREEYLAAAIDEMRTRHGDVETYFADGLGIGRDRQACLRAALLQT